jgi:hypothetical protein
LPGTYNFGQILHTCSGSFALNLSKDARFLPKNATFALMIQKLDEKFSGTVGGSREV